MNRVLARAALFGASLLLSLAAAEVALRLLRLEPNSFKSMDFSPRTPYQVIDKALGEPPVVLAASTTTYQSYYACRGTDCKEDLRVEWKTNYFGMRDRERTLAKPPKTLRILVLGDSFTVGYGVPAEDAYPQRLERLLNERTGGKPRIEVLNSAVPAYSTYDEWKYLTKYGLRFQPDLIVVGLYLNDSEPWSPFFKPKNHPEFFDSLRKIQLHREFGEISKDPFISNYNPTWEFHHRLYLLNWAEAAWIVWRANPETIRLYRYLWSSDNWLGMERFNQALDGLRAVKNEKNIPVLVLIWPKLDWLDKDYPFDAIHEQIRKLCARRGLVTGDMLSLLRGKKPSSLWVHPSDHHPNAATHALAAEALANILSIDPKGKFVIVSDGDGVRAAKE